MPWRKILPLEEWDEHKGRLARILYESGPHCGEVGLILDTHLSYSVNVLVNEKKITVYEDDVELWEEPKE